MHCSSTAINLFGRSILPGQLNWIEKSICKGIFAVAGRRLWQTRHLRTLYKTSYSKALAVIIALVWFSAPSVAYGEPYNQARGLSAGSAEATSSVWIYTSRPNDSIRSIANTYLAQPERWIEILRGNPVNPNGLLPPGTHVKIPVRLLKHYPKPATLVERKQEVWYRKAQTTAYVPALDGLQLNIGDELKTLEGFALIRFADGSTLRIAKQSIIIFNTLTHYGETGMVDIRFRLNRGKIKTRVTPRKGPAARYEVSTPSAVAAVRGTAFRVRVLAGATTTEVIEGTVVIYNATHRLSLAAGEGSRISNTGSLDRLQLLAAPAIQIPAIISQLPTKLRWQALPNAFAYLVEIIKGQRDNLPIQSQRLTTPAFDLPDLPNGQYWLSIRGIDSNGIEGLEAQAPFTIKISAEPAVLRKPLASAELKTPAPQFSWQPTRPGLLSSLELAEDQIFQNIYAKTSFRPHPNAIVERPLLAGEYFWRVITLAGGDSLASSEIRSVTIKRELEATSVIAVNYLRDRAKVYWKSVQNADSYLLQLAEDERFERLLREDLQTDTSALLRLTPGKTYWVRVKGLGNQFYASHFGQAKIIKIQI